MNSYPLLIITSYFSVAVFFFSGCKSPQASTEAIIFESTSYFREFTCTKQNFSELNNKLRPLLSEVSSETFKTQICSKAYGELSAFNVKMRNTCSHDLLLRCNDDNIEATKSPLSTSLGISITANLTGNIDVSRNNATLNHHIRPAYSFSIEISKERFQKGISCYTEQAPN